jgi:moderate conductance mechanosensitive channel
MRALLADIAWTLPNGDQVSLGGYVEAAVAVVAIVAAGWLLIRLTHVFVRGVVRALGARDALTGVASDLTAVEIKKRQDTIEALIVNVVRFFVLVIAGLMVLEALFPRLDIGPAVAGLGIAGVAVGLGTQSLVRDYLNGALILLENQFAIGDVINAAGIGGVVEEFTLRRTVLRDLDGTLHSIPNGQITVASNLTRTWARVNEKVRVVYGTDLDKARSIIDGIGREMAADETLGPLILEPPHVERIAELGDRAVVLLVLAKVRASSQWAVGGEFRARLLRAFHGAGVEMPQSVVITGPNTPVADETNEPAV